MSGLLKKQDAYRVYLLLSGGYAFAFALIVTINLVYHVQQVGLNPLQLVLVGTVLEITCLLFEVPTGVVADVYSRRLSVLIGLALIGAGFIIEGNFGTFAGVLVAQVVWGIGATFMSGATDAWIADEVGEARAAQAYLRAAQVSRVGGLAGIILSALLASIYLPLPIVLGGITFVLMAIGFAIIMPENGFKPAPREDRTAWRSLFKTLGEGVGLVRKRRALLLILLVSAVFGMFSEGSDRLSTAHLIETIKLPAIAGLAPVAWFGIINGFGMFVDLFGVEFLRRRINTNHIQEVARALRWLYAGLIAGVIVFALAQSLLVAILAMYWAGIMRAVMGPLERTWMNAYTSSSVRATVFSLSAQMNAGGQILGGPVVGYIGLVWSLRAALTIAALLLTPALWLFGQQINTVEETASENGLVTAPEMA